MKNGDVRRGARAELVIAGLCMALCACAQSRTPQPAVDSEGEGRAMPALPETPSSPATPARAPDEYPAVEDSPLLVTQTADGGWDVRTADGAVLAKLPSVVTADPMLAQTSPELQVTADYVLLSRSATHYSSSGPAVFGDPLAGTTSQQLLLLRRPGFELVWQWPSSQQLIADAQLGANGQVALYEIAEGGISERTVVVAPSGEQTIIEGVVPLSAPDADGWFAVRFPLGLPPMMGGAVPPEASPRSAGAVPPSDEARGGYGFARASDGSVRPLAESFHVVNSLPAPPVGVEPLIGPGAQFDYLADDDRGGLWLVHETPEAVQRIALGRAPVEAPLVQRGEHAWLLSLWNVGTSAFRPWLGVDMADGLVSERNVPDPGSVASAWLVGGDWFLVRRDDGADGGRLNAASGEWRPTPALPPGQRVFDTDYCHSHSAIMDDGRAVMPLRDDASGGVYVENAEGPGFTRVSAPIRDAVYVEIQRFGATLELTAMKQSNTYCVPATWPAPAPQDVQLLLGGQVQLIRGPRSLIVSDPFGLIAIDPSGRFAVVSHDDELTLHDLDRGSATVLAGADRVIGWL